MVSVGFDRVYWHALCTTTEDIMARDKRPFGTIRKLPSGRYQAQYTTPEQRRVPAPHTFAARIDAEGGFISPR